jgi:hypothetical protein
MKDQEIAKLNRYISRLKKEHSRYMCTGEGIEKKKSHFKKSLLNKSEVKQHMEQNKSLRIEIQKLQKQNSNNNENTIMVFIMRLFFFTHHNSRNLFIF